MKLQNGEITLKNIYPKRLHDKTQEMLFEGIEIDSEGKPKNNLTIHEGLERTRKVEEYKMIQMTESIIIDGVNCEVSEKMIDKLSLPDYKKILESIDKIAGLNQEVPLPNNSK